MEQKIKDLDNYVKDSKTGAILFKRAKTPTEIKIQNLEREIKYLNELLYSSNETLLNKINELNRKIEQLETIIIISNKSE